LFHATHHAFENRGHEASVDGTAHDAIDEYQFSINETDEKAFDLQRFKNPDVRYYACVIDKNRAGPKPKLLFRLNLAYNYWEELGYLRLKNRPYEGGQ